MRIGYEPYIHQCGSRERTNHTSSVDLTEKDSVRFCNFETQLDFHDLDNCTLKNDSKDVIEVNRYVPQQGVTYTEKQATSTKATMGEDMDRQATISISM
jgi:hypothetical protein